MLIKIDAESDIPIYTQLCNQIIEGIARGSLKKGDSLPSVRSLAADLGINMHTVNKSYHELERKGIIAIIPKSGAVISPEQELDNRAKQRLVNQLRPLIAEALVLGMSPEEVEKLTSDMIQELS